MTDTDALSAWQQVVSGEDAAIYAYGLAGARVASASRERAARGRREHQQARARAAGFITQATGEVPEPVPAYDIGPLPADATEAAGVLARIELALVPVYAAAAGASETAQRRSAVAEARRNE